MNKFQNIIQELNGLAPNYQTKISAVCVTAISHEDKHGIYRYAKSMHASDDENVAYFQDAHGDYT